jgi:serine/threonine protein kinase/WD40 repeat protein
MSSDPLSPSQETVEVPPERPGQVRPAHKHAEQIGPFRILEKIGEGGMGIVYKAEQREPVRRIVALKVIKLGMDTREVVARFEAERQALAMLSHPNVARVLDAGMTENGRPYFAMEHVPGIPLTQYCDEHQLATRQRLELFIPICQAVQHAHQKGIIHRDLKPTNILVTLVDGKPVPKVIDFGIAKATNQALTQHTLFTRTGAMIGTPEYMSPEQAMTSGLDVDTRTDIYSLGVILYELLTGSLPLDAKALRAAGLEEMVRLIRNTEPSKPSTRLVTLAEAGSAGTTSRQTRNIRTIQRELRGDLDWIVLKAMEKDRSRRYETANGLAADLNRHLNNEPVLARPPSAVYRFRKAFRRNRVSFTAAMVVALALVVGIGVSTWQMIAARHARNGEQRQRLEAQSAQGRAETERQRADAQAQHSRRLLYGSDMNLAQQALKLNNVGRARRLLERHRPQPGEDDLRGWEWRYLWQLTRSNALATLANRPTRGFSVSFSPDGSRLAVGWFDGRVELWDVPARRLVRALTERQYPHQGRVEFSPVRNLLAATSEPKTATLYDLDTGRESIVWRAPDEGEWGIRDLAFSQDGSRLVVYAGAPFSSNTTATPKHDDRVWVVNVSSGRSEGDHATAYSSSDYFGGARLSPDNSRLYLARSDGLNYRYGIQCIDLITGKEVWQTEPQRDHGLSTLDISPDGRVLATGSGFEDPNIRIWDAASGRLLARLDGHTGWVCKVVFSADGRHLISSASDQSIRYWDTSNWTEDRVLRGHSDEVHAVAISRAAKLIASASKDGNLMLWKADGESAVNGYRRLSTSLSVDQVLPLDGSRLLLLPPDKPPELVDLKLDSPSTPLPWLKSAADLLGRFDGNALWHWNGSDQMIMHELRGAQFVERAAGSLNSNSGQRPLGLAYDAAHELVAWAEGISPKSVYLMHLARPGDRVELKCDSAGLIPILFSADGSYVAAATKAKDALRVWNRQTGQIVASIDEHFYDATFAAGGGALVVALEQGSDHRIAFFDLAHADRGPRLVPGRSFSRSLAVSPAGGLVASSAGDGQVRLFNPAGGELMGSLYGHLNSAFGIAFSGDGQRLISASGGRESIKLWDVRTQQELLTLSGTGSLLFAARWSADGDTILAGAPWQAWSAPSWEEIAAAESKEKTEIKHP